MPPLDQQPTTRRRTGVRRVLLHVVVPWTMGGLLLTFSIFGCVSFIRVWPALGWSVLGIWLGLMVLLGVSEVRSRQDFQKREAELGMKQCPTCGLPFGADAAHVAMNPPPDPEDEISDDFGLAEIRCPHCQTRFLFRYQCEGLHLQEFGRGAAAGAEFPGAPE